MARFAELDLCDRLAPGIPVWATQIGAGLLCAGMAGAVRGLLDIIVPGAAVFPLVFPAAMIATLFARLGAGAIAATVSILYAGYYIYPVRNSFNTDPKAAVAIGTVVVAAAITVMLAELFRRAVRRATQERDREIADRDLFLAEFDHRMKNNFSVVAGLLDMQRRRSSDPAVEEALSVAQTRVDSIARAHRHLYRGAGQPGVVDMADYLRDLCGALSDALFLRGGITLACDSDAAAVPRDRAVSIGLIVNELVTNAAKHAFKGRDIGAITTTFRNRTGGGWVVVVSDDGVGLPANPAQPSNGNGLGTRLVTAFARQANGTITAESDSTGTRITLELAP